MTERQLEYTRMSSKQLISCLKRAVLNNTNIYEFQEIEETVLRRMANPTIELIPGIQGEPVQSNPPPFNPEVDLPGGKLNDPVCPKCHHFITDDEQNTIEGEQVCSDCYYGALGEEVERYPIGGHRMSQ